LELSAASRKKKAISTGATVGIIAVILVAIGAAVYLGISAGTGQTQVQTSGSSTSTPTTTSSSSVPPQASKSQAAIPSGASTPPSSWDGSTHVTSALYFSPSIIVVVVGVNNTVVWTNQDSAPHTIFSYSVPAGASSFNSNAANPSGVPAGGTFTYTFQTPGVYKYYCTFHPWMGGEVIVKSG